ncbi:MAG TPA: DNA-3-methyladenine glycosylase [Actinomycetales bacterium]|nr:DNA-3-methyladenine glycosylase [Actinomycetales bacterium]
MSPRPAHRAVVGVPAPSPWSPDEALGHVVATAVPGCEEVRDGAYRRTVALAHRPAVVAVRPAADHAECTLWLGDPRDEPQAVAACRRLLDLDHGADDDRWPVEACDVVRVLRSDPTLRPVVDRSPGQRLPRCVDAAELAVRAVLGQQVSTAAARTLARRLVLDHGSPLEQGDPAGDLTHLWPTPRQLLGVDPASLAMPGSRRRAFAGLVRALAQGELDLAPGCDVATARKALLAVPGVGPWTVEIVALRGLGDPDAFPASDLGVRRAAARLGLPDSPTTLLRHAERWRPFRSYAVQYLWSTLDHQVNRDWRVGGHVAGGAA